MTSPFVPGPPLRIAGASRGPLAGLTFAAKDLFDVAGSPTGGGTPDWARDHPIPTRHAWAVQRLLDAGATLIGKTVTDEVSLGILGENPFEGTPLNPAAPDRVPGGSSSGSASAVAQALCDIALGTDTGGSVRVPASFCGLYGIRPTHGRLDLTGMMAQAPSSDTTGWFARDADTFARCPRRCSASRSPAPADAARGRRRRLRPRRCRDGGGAPAAGHAARGAGRRPARGCPRAAGPLDVGAGPAHAPAVRGLAHLQGLARPRKSATGLQRGALSRSPARSPRRSGTGRR